MVDPEKVEAWFDRRRLTLDMVGLSEGQRAEGSHFLGGSTAKYVSPEDQFDYAELSTIVFGWGDPEAEDVIAQMLEHDDNPDEENLFPFNASTVIENQLWMLAVQDRQFDPTTAYESPADYIEMPFDASMAWSVLDEYIRTFPTRIQLIGRVGSRWMCFEMGHFIGA